MVCAEICEVREECRWNLSGGCQFEVSLGCCGHFDGPAAKHGRDSFRLDLIRLVAGSLEIRRLNIAIEVKSAVFTEVQSSHEDSTGPIEKGIFLPLI